jgi:hypothetical protein
MRNEADNDSVMLYNERNMKIAWRDVGASFLT